MTWILHFRTSQEKRFNRSRGATHFARNFLLNYNINAASIDNKPVTSAGLSQVYAGDAAAELIVVDPSDPRVPDVIGISQYGVVYTAPMSKIAEHGGDHTEDRNVPVLVVLPGSPVGTAVTKPVETTQDSADNPGAARPRPK